MSTVYTYVENLLTDNNDFEPELQKKTSISAVTLTVLVVSLMGTVEATGVVMMAIEALPMVLTKVVLMSARPANDLSIRSQGYHGNPAKVEDPPSLSTFDGPYLHQLTLDGFF